MIKRLAIISTLVFSVSFIVIPSKFAFAADVNLVAYKAIYVGSSVNDNSYSTNSITDNLNNTSYYVNAGKYVWYQFSDPVKITNMTIYANGLGPLNGATLKIFKTDNSTITIPGFGYSSGYYPSKPVSQVKKISIYANVAGWITELRVIGAEDRLIVHDEISNLSVNNDSGKNTISWTTPISNVDFTNTKLYRNGVLLSTLDKDIQTYEDSNIQSNTEYTYKVTAIYSDGYETQGIEKQVTTPPPPPPKLDGVNYDHNDNGDLIVRWDEPTKGQIKVVVGGKDYATVPASQKQMTIAKKDIVKDAMGNEDVKLIPIGEDGQTGDTVKKPTEIEKAEIPFGANDLLTTSLSILALVGGFLLLALSFLVVPKLRKSIAEGLKNGRRTRETRAYREGKEPREERISAKEERTQREPRLREAREHHEYRASARDD